MAGSVPAGLVHVPEDVKREGDHPAPFPEKLPARLMRLYTYQAVGNFPGEIVLDPFVGTGTTCAVAKTMGRRYVGIDINPAYIKIAQERSATPQARPPFVGRPRQIPGKEELMEMAAIDSAGRNGKDAGEKKHKRKSYGRKVEIKKQLTLV